MVCRYFQRGTVVLAGLRKYVVLAIFAVGTCLFAGDLQLDMEKSWVSASARATGHSFTANPTQFNCGVVLNDANEISAASFSFSVADLVTGKKKRDKEMWHWLEVEKYANVTFTMKQLKEENGQKVIIGDFELHNVHQTLEIPIVVVNEDGQMKISGEVTLDTRQFDLPIIRKMGLFKVKPHLTVTFELLGTV